MATDFPAGLPVGVLVLVEARKIAVLNRAELGVLYPEGLVAWRGNNWRVNDGNGLRQLHLVPKLVVQIYRRQEKVLKQMQV